MLPSPVPKSDRGTRLEENVRVVFERTSDVPTGLRWLLLCASQDLPFLFVALSVRVHPGLFSLVPSGN